MAPEMFAVGEVVRGRYRVERLIGKGGMGEVYEAHDLEEGRRVALKTVLPKLLGSDKILARFRREVALVSRIEHPNVMPIFDVFEVPPPEDADSDRPVPCMITELLAGETLADRLARSGPFEPAEALPLAIQMAEALDASHRAGVVHRDLKPDNVFLLPESAGRRAVLTDFGVARSSVSSGHTSSSSDSLTATNVILGTPNYLAPEQLELESATPTSDIYALGLVMFEMVTGHLPFESESPLKMVFKRVKEDAPSPRLYVRDLAPEWEETILRCLRREPEKRFATAGEIARSLAGEPRHATGEHQTVAEPASSDRRWLVPFLVLLLMLALLITYVLAF